MEKCDSRDKSRLLYCTVIASIHLVTSSLKSKTNRIEGKNEKRKHEFQFKIQIKNYLFEY